MTKAPIRVNAKLDLVPGYPVVLVPVRPADRHAFSLLKPDTWLNIVITKPRSPQAHKLFFAVLNFASEHWPDGADPLPQGDEKLLRAWLLVKAGYNHFYDFEPDQVDSIVGLMRDIQARDKFCFTETVYIGTQPKLRIHVPESIAWDELDEVAFTPIRKAVFEIIESVIGAPIEVIIDQMKRA